MMFKTGALLLAAAAGVSAAPTDGPGCAAPPPAQSSGCSSYTIIDTRGTTEPQGDSLGFITMNKSILKQLPGGKIYDTVYPATWDQNSAPGTKDLLNHIRTTLAKNPSECFILEGYSQGATVTDDALPQLTGAEFDAVKGVFLIGNPRRKPGLACNVDIKGGDSTKDSKGIVYGAGPSIPDNWVSKSLDVCNYGDGVCDTAHGDGITIQHLAYPADANMQKFGAEFVVKKLKGQ